MATKQLTDFFEPAKQEAKLKVEEKQAESFVESVRLQEHKHRRSEFEAPLNLPQSYFVSATYDGQKGSVAIKLYEPNSKRIYFWHDTTGHKPYLLTNLSPIELEKMDHVTGHTGFDHFETVEKYDPLLDRNMMLTKVVAKDPLAVGGRPSGCLRDIIPDDWAKMGGEPPAKVWEAAIKYYQCYIYDRQIAPGMIYKIENGQLVHVNHESSEQMIRKIQTLFVDEPEEFLQPIETWARLLEYPAPEFRRVALDIEVFIPTIEIEGKVAFRMPDPREANYQVLCATFQGTDGKKEA
jgi:DNA polymerase I